MDNFAFNHISFMKSVRFRKQIVDLLIYQGDININSMQEDKSTSRNLAEIRQHIQYLFIPQLVQSVNDGYLPSIALFPSPLWYYNLRHQFDEGSVREAKVYEECERIEIDSDHILILYTFPEPWISGQAAYGAIILNTSANQADYYTLQAGPDGRWQVAHVTASENSVLETWDSLDRNRFADWASGRLN